MWPLPSSKPEHPCNSTTAGYGAVPSGRLRCATSFVVPSREVKFTTVCADAQSRNPGRFRVKNGSRGLAAGCLLHPTKRTLDAHSRGPFCANSGSDKPYSITSSAVATSEAGISRPSDFAVLRLITVRNLAGCSIGSWFALTPFRI